MWKKSAVHFLKRCFSRKMWLFMVVWVVVVFFIFLRIDSIPPSWLPKAMNFPLYSDYLESTEIDLPQKVTAQEDSIEVGSILNSHHSEMDDGPLKSKTNNGNLQPPISNEEVTTTDAEEPLIQLLPTTRRSHHAGRIRENPEDGLTVELEPIKSAKLKKIAYKPLANDSENKVKEKLSVKNARLKSHKEEEDLEEEIVPPHKVPIEPLTPHGDLMGPDRALEQSSRELPET